MCLCDALKYRDLRDAALMNRKRSVQRRINRVVDANNGVVYYRTVSVERGNSSLAIII
jgi:hypothetical protein